MRPLTQYISCLQLALWALVLYASVFAVEYGLFNWLVTSKQKALEIFAPLLLITVPLVYALQKQWRVTIVDIMVLLLAALLHGIFTPAKQSKREDQSELSNPGLVIAFKGSLITLLTFGLFSYPFDLSPFVLIAITLLAVLAPFSKSLLNISSPHIRWSALPIFLILAAFSIIAYPLRKEHYQALSVWQDADRFYSLENYEIAIEAYQEAYPALKNNGLFLQMYGKALSMDEQYHKSNMILSEAKQYKSSQIIQNTLGDNHNALGNYAQAEEAYIKSAQMIPSTVFPKYLLAKLYSENGQHKKAKQIAETILNSEVKVESSATREIMNEMKKISEQYD